jgi:uncharacterized membrane protein
MSYREKENLINIFSGIIITAIFGWIAYQRHMSGVWDLENDFSQWGKALLYFMGISIGARIAIYIVFSIINTIVTKEEDIPKKDERDKLIKLKATRNAYYTFSIGMLGGIIFLAIGMPVYGIFITFIGAGLLTEIMENVSQIYFYRKGV